MRNVVEDYTFYTFSLVVVVLTGLGLTVAWVGGLGRLIRVRLTPLRLVLDVERADRRERLVKCVRQTLRPDHVIIITGTSHKPCRKYLPPPQPSRAFARALGKLGPPIALGGCAECGSG